MKNDSNIGKGKNFGTFKHKIWGLYSQLIKHNCIGSVIYFLLLFISALQTLYFPFVFSEYDKNLSMEASVIFKALLYVPYTISSNVLFLIIWIIHYSYILFTIILFSALLFYNDKSGHSESFMMGFFLRLLGVMLILYRTIFAIPMVFSFLVPLFCTGEYEDCWSSENFVVSVLSVFGLILSLCLMVIAEFYRDGYM